MRHSLQQDDTCYFLDDFNIKLFDFVQEIRHDDPLKVCIIQAKERKEDDPKITVHFACLKANDNMVQKKESEEINDSRGRRLKPSIEDPPVLELKELLDHLEYAFLREGATLLMIIALNFRGDQKEKLLCVLNQHKRL